MSGGAVNPGNTSNTRPASALARPAHSSDCARSPCASATPIIVACTAPNSSKAPVPTSRLT